MPIYVFCSCFCVPTVELSSWDSWASKDEDIIWPFTESLLCVGMDTCKQEQEPPTPTLGGTTLSPKPLWAPLWVGPLVKANYFFEHLRVVNLPSFRVYLISGNCPRLFKPIQVKRWVITPKNETRELAKGRTRALNTGWNEMVVRNVVSL